MSAPPQTHSKDPVDDKNLWATHPYYVERAAKELGVPLVLDVAAQAHTAKCPQWFGPEHPDPARRCGLSAEWDAPWWANPPFGTMADWVAKAIQSSQPGAFICFANMATDWMHLLLEQAESHRSTILIPNRRIAYIDTKGTLQGSPPKASVLFLMYGRERLDLPTMRRWEIPSSLPLIGQEPLFPVAKPQPSLFSLDTHTGSAANASALPAGAESVVGS